MKNLRRRMTLIAVLSIVSLWTGDLKLPSVNAQDPSGPKQIIKNKEVMEFFFRPYYVDLRNATRKEPAGRKDWRAVYVASYRLSEATNLLFFREGHEYMGTEEWNQMAVASRNAAVAIGEAIKKLDFELVKKNYQTLIESCNNCHQRFKPNDPTEVKP